MRKLFATIFWGLVITSARPALATEEPKQPASQPVEALPPAPAPQPSLDAELTKQPLAGYASGGFFLRDPNSWFVLLPKGRLQIDSYFFPGRGNPKTPSNAGNDARPKDTVFVRRARVELYGNVVQHFDFHFGGEIATVPATGAFGTLADAYVVVNYTPFAQLQIGQFDAPFTLENRTSDKYFDFMERSVAVRSFGVPSNKEIGLMVFGFLPKKLAYYSLGVFNGDGQNFKNQDDRPAWIGRAFVAPLAPFANGRRWMEDIWVGASGWLQHSDNLGGPAAANTGGAAQNDLTGMSTQGGVGFFSSSYGNGANANGFGVRSHLVPNGDIRKWALELNVPIKFAGVRAEYIHQDADLGQYNDVGNDKGALSRSIAGSAKLSGSAYYIELYGWIIGDVNYIETPGLEPTARLSKITLPNDWKWGLMVAGRYEHVGFDVTGLPTKTAASGATVADAAEGHYGVDVYELGVNLWATKHVRLSANYALNWIHGDSTAVKNNFYYHRNEHELMFRVGVNL